MGRLLFFLGGLLPAILASARGDPLQRHYRLKAEVAPSLRKITGEVEVTLRNEGPDEISSLVLVAYPNRFRKEIPDLNDLTFYRIYPYGVSRGGLSVEEIRQGEARLRWSEKVVGELPSGTFYDVPLASPLRPGGTTELRIRYGIDVPKKYGSFGFYDGRLTLGGGWYPYVAAYRNASGFDLQAEPPPAAWDVELLSPAPLVSQVGLSPAGKTSLHFPDSREVTVLTAGGLEAERLSGTVCSVTLVLPKGERESRPYLRELIVAWLEDLERRPELKDGSCSFVVTQAPLRESLARSGDGVVYVSDRAFKLFEGLAQYHAIAILKELYYQRVYPAANRKEGSRDARWAAEAVAWHWVERFIRDKTFEHTDARTLTFIQWLKVFASIDRLVYAPQFAFYDVFYNLVYPSDPVRDDARRFNHSRPFGRTMYARLQDEIGTREAALAAAQYLRSDRTLRALAEEVSGRDLSVPFGDWAAPRPRVNYELQRPHVKKSESARHYEVKVERESRTPVREPVELLVQSESEEKVLRWYDAEPSHTFRFDTKEPVDVLEVDPRGRLQETRLADNRRPPRYKFVLTTLLFDYDFNANHPIVSAAGEFGRAYGGNNRYNIGAFLTDDTYGFHLGYTRLFGRLIDRLRLTHGLGVSYGLSKLDEDLTLAEDPTGGPPEVFKLADSGRSTWLSAGYFFGNQLSYTNPMSGGGAVFSGTWGSQALGGDFDYYLLGASGSWIYPVHPSHLLAVRGELGLSGPDDIPSQVQYSLGGVGGMRGLSVSDDQFKGRYFVLTTVEYRHMIVRDLDWNIEILRLRDFQGALFTDAGRVSDTLAEKASQAVFGASKSTGVGDLFDFSQYETDIGYGLRFHVDYLGVNPGLLSFDVAKSLSQWNEGVRFYVGFLQSF